MISCQYFLCYNTVMNEVKHNDDTFARPESSYDVAKITDYYAKATEGSQRILPEEKRRYVMCLR